MPRTLSRFIDFQKFVIRGNGAITVIKLMMACNDLSLANEAAATWKQEKAKIKAQRRDGARMYFVRTQIAHLYEGLKIVDAIKRDAVLLFFVEKCDPQTQESFRHLEDYLPGGTKRAMFERLAGQVRHNLAFHYNETGKLIEKAIADRASHTEAHISSVTKGDDVYLWHFKAAADVVDSTVVRQIWHIPRNVDLRSEADRIADHLHQVFLWFMDFAGEFIWRYCGN
jgi:hypothetical protein